MNTMNDHDGASAFTFHTSSHLGSSEPSPRHLLYDGSYKTSFDHLTRQQQIANQVVLKTSAVLSICGSGYIIYNLLGPRRESELQKSMFSRLLLGLCVADWGASVCLFLGSWPIPSDSFHSDSLVWNVGNQATCDAQGFLLQVFYFVSIFYTASLSVNFLLCVKHQWREPDLKKRAEPCLHAISWGIPIVLAVVGQVFELYNPTAFFCYVVAYPIGCDHYEDVDCVRGNRSWMWRSLMQIVPFGVCLATILYCMAMIYATVREQEKAVSKYSSAWVERKARDSKLALRKASLYVGVFLVVWTPVLLVALCEDLGQTIPFAVWVIDAFLIPIVGLFNGLVYSRMMDLRATVTKSFSSVKKSLRSGSLRAASSLLSTRSMEQNSSKFRPSTSGGGPQSLNDNTSKPFSSTAGGVEESKREEEDAFDANANASPPRIMEDETIQDISDMNISKKPTSREFQRRAEAPRMMEEVAEDTGGFGIISKKPGQEFQKAETALSSVSVEGD